MNLLPLTLHADARFTRIKRVSKFYISECIVVNQRIGGHFTKLLTTKIKVLSLFYTQLSANMSRVRMPVFHPCIYLVLSSAQSDKYE